MPIYEFKCFRCGKEFEKLVMGSEDRDVACPACGYPETRRIMSSFTRGGPGKNVEGSCGGSSRGFS